MTVGRRLAEERRAQGRSLEEIEQATRVRGRMLSALENEQWDSLPARAYVKGYIQGYAQVLGIDPAPLLAEYSRIAGRADTPAEELARIPDRTVVPHHREVHAPPRRVVVALLVLAAAAGLLAWGISAVIGRDDSPPPIPPVGETSPTVGATATPGEGTTAPAGAFILDIRVLEGRSSAVRVTVDGLVAYDGTLPGGQSRQWTVSDLAVVTIADPGAVVLTRDGLAVEFPAGGGNEITLHAGAE